MSRLPDIFTDLAGVLAQFPGVGRRGAERMALELPEWPSQRLERLSDLLQQLESAGSCERCGVQRQTPHGECRNCSQPLEGEWLCVVPGHADLAAIEHRAAFRGHFHVLGGEISPLDGISLDTLRIDALLRRLAREQPAGLLLALSASLEGRMTTDYLCDLLGQECPHVSVTRLDELMELPEGARVRSLRAEALDHAFRQLFCDVRL